MVSVNQIADLLTLSRGLVVFAFVWLGVVHGAAGLNGAIYLLLFSWTSDCLDGPLARRGDRRYHSWISEHDLEIDMVVSGGLLVYMVAAGFMDPRVAGPYVLAWALIFWRWGMSRSLAMLIQAPIYGWFIWVAVRDAWPAGQWLIGWIIAAIIVTWPRFPREIVPGFLEGMRAVGNHPPDPDDR